MGGTCPLSSTSAIISSGAIHLVDLAKKKEMPLLMVLDISSMTLESPKSVMMALGNSMGNPMGIAPATHT